MLLSFSLVFANEDNGAGEGDPSIIYLPDGVNYDVVTDTEDLKVYENKGSIDPEDPDKAEEPIKFKNTEISTEENSKITIKKASDDDRPMGLYSLENTFYEVTIDGSGSFKDVGGDTIPFEGEGTFLINEWGHLQQANYDVRPAELEANYHALTLNGGKKVLIGATKEGGHIDFTSAKMMGSYAYSELILDGEGLSMDLTDSDQSINLMPESEEDFSKMAKVYMANGRIYSATINGGSIAPDTKKDFLFNCKGKLEYYGISKVLPKEEDLGPLAIIDWITGMGEDAPDATLKRGFDGIYDLVGEAEVATKSDYVIVGTKKDSWISYVDKIEESEGSIEKISVDGDFVIEDLDGKRLFDFTDGKKSYSVENLRNPATYNDMEINYNKRYTSLLNRLFGEKRYVNNINFEADKITIDNTVIKREGSDFISTEPEDYEYFIVVDGETVGVASDEYAAQELAEAIEGEYLTQEQYEYEGLVTLYSDFSEYELTREDRRDYYQKLLEIQLSQLEL